MQLQPAAAVEGDVMVAAALALGFPLVVEEVGDFAGQFRPGGVNDDGLIQLADAGDRVGDQRVAGLRRAMIICNRLLAPDGGGSE